MLAILFALCAHADDVSFEAVRVVRSGDAPSFTVTAEADGALDVVLTCGGASAEAHRRVASGQQVTVSVDGLTNGEHACTATVRFENASGDWAETEVPLEVHVVPPMTLTAGRDDVDLPGRAVTIHADRPLSQLTIQVYGAYGEVVGEGATAVDGERKAVLGWAQADGTEAIRLDVRGTDTHGFASELVLLPWSYAIPHEDVNFESGSHQIRRSEVHKLEAVLGEIAAVREKYGAIAEIQLFVAGYTDTVGGRGYNQGLSERRARAIARWFHDRGVGPVWYQGFGEDVLAVSTPDQTDEEANRRALYIVAAEAPWTSPEIPRDDWVRVR